MNVRFTPNTQNITRVTDAQKNAIIATAEQLRHEVISAAVIPFDTGHLQNVSTYVDTAQASAGKIAIRHDAPYAGRLYYNPDANFRKTYNSNARSEWWEPWLTGDKSNRPKMIFKEFMRRYGGGVIR